MNRRRSDAYNRQCQEHLKFEQCNGRKPESLMRCWRQGADLANLHQSVVVRDRATCHNDGVKPPLVEPKTHALLGNRRYPPGCQAGVNLAIAPRSGAAGGHRMTRKNTTSRTMVTTHGILPVCFLRLRLYTVPNDQL